MLTVYFSTHAQYLTWLSALGRDWAWENIDGYANKMTVLELRAASQAKS